MSIAQQIDKKEKAVFLSMDEIFEKYKNYGDGVNTDDISDEDMYECEQYPLPEWWGKGWDLVRVNKNA